MVLPLAALLVLRAVAAFLPGTWLWGLDVQRYLPPAIGWALWALMAISLVPWLGDRMAALGSRVGAGTVSATPWVALAAALVTAALVLALPDRGHFLGDFQMRERIIRQGLFEATLQQSLPLDVLLHDRMPRWLQAHASLDPALYARLLGAAEAAGLAALGVVFARLTLPASPSASGAGALPWLAIAASIGAPLAMCTGFAKPTSDLCVLVLATAVLGMKLLRNERVHLGFGAVLTLALLDHRTSILFLPAAAYVVARRLRERDAVWRVALAALPPLVTLAALTPRIQQIVREYDVPMHMQPALVATTATWSALGVRTLDIANSLLLTAPLIVLLPLVRRLPRAIRERADLRFLAILALTHAVVFLLDQPRQGHFRDWEVFAPAALTLTLVATWTLGALTAARLAAPGLSFPAALATAVPALGLLLAAHAPESGLAWARAFQAGPPARGASERMYLWDYVARRSMDLGRWRDGAVAAEKVAEAEPSRGALLSWGLAATKAGETASARRAFERMLAQRPGDLAAWVGLGGTATRLGDAATADTMRARLSLALRDERARRVLAELLRDNPELWPGLADSLVR